MAIQHIHHGIGTGRSVTAHTPTQSAATRVRVPRLVVGVLAIVGGAWGGLVPYIGQAISLSADGSATWTWNLQHSLLYLLPGIVAAVGGSIAVLSAWVDHVRRLDLSRVTLPIVAILLGLSGIWFLLGPSVWPIFYSGHTFVATSPARGFAEKVVYDLAAGIALSVLAGVAGTWGGRALRPRPALAED
jgi:hypothetical protein